jgi:N-acetylglucosamine kinase-like BadF-type ATPase
MRMAAERWVLGVDGGATTTTALLAELETGQVIGRGTGGSSNIQAVGETAALRELNTAVAAAFAAAGLRRQPVAAAALGLAGIDLDGEDVIRGWADLVDLADRLLVVNDARLLFAAGTPQDWGLAIIAGTGSIAYTRTPEGNNDRTGGWGWLLGDEGSAFQIGLRALRAVCRAADGVGPPTRLSQIVLEKLESAQIRDLIPAVYRGSWDKAFIARLAPVVLDCAHHDEVAEQIVASQAQALARTAAAAVRQMPWPEHPIPTALSGGLFLHSGMYRARFLDFLRQEGVHPEPVTLVEEPARGAVLLARQLCTDLA